MPPAHSGAFVVHMDEILDVSPTPYAPQVPVSCMDAQPVSLLKETRQPLPAAPGQPERVDDEYERHGTAHIFLCTEPLRGTRHVPGTEPRTAVDWATESRDLREVRTPDAVRVRLGWDNLTTHGLGSLSEAFPPAQAHRLASRLELPHTPTHGSWRNSAEIDRSVLTRPCLERRPPDLETLTKETHQWEQRRNTSQQGVDWQCSTLDARITLRRLYPQIQS
jgi:DDE superfamily endonuclease